ncbi:MAG: hypothetical protein IPM01_18870 [Burkholderiaceae bacterium]|nr:hypothetical protein [Burkholderiaceae bacterium]
MASGRDERRGTRFDGFTLSLSAADAAQAEQRVNALSAGGQVRMSLGKTFWSPTCAAC